MRIFEHANFKIVQSRRLGYIVSGIFLTVSLISLLLRGVQFGIDFEGGVELVLNASEELEVSIVRSQVGAVLGEDPEVKFYGNNQSVLIRTTVTGDLNDIQQAVVSGMQAGYPNATLTVEKADNVGPRFAEELKSKALYAVLGALFVIFVYISIRFQWRFSLGAVAALFHDVFITLGLFSLFNGIVPFSLEINQAIIAAFLTIVGYSLNDTVVIFDRIREYTLLFKSDDYEGIVNRSVNNTLSRTVVTSLTTLCVVAILFIFGGEVLRGFAFALLIGIFLGTYSSVFIATPLVVELQKVTAKK